MCRRMHPTGDHARSPDPQRWHDIIVQFGVHKVVHAGSISGPMLMRDAPARLNADWSNGSTLALRSIPRVVSSFPCCATSESVTLATCALGSTACGPMLRHVRFHLTS